MCIVITVPVEGALRKITSMFQLDGCHPCWACGVPIIKWYGFVVHPPPPPLPNDTVTL